MPLNNTVFTFGNAPDHTSDLINIAKTRPNLAEAFQKGRAAQDKHASDVESQKLAVLAYEKAKRDADLAMTLYPEQTAFQRSSMLSQTAANNAQINAYNQLRNLQPTPSAITPGVPTASPSQPATQPQIPGPTLNQYPTTFNLGPTGDAPFQPGTSDFGLGGGIGFQPAPGTLYNPSAGAPIEGDW